MTDWSSRNPQCFRKCSDAPEIVGKHAAAPRGVPSAEVQAADQTAVPEAARAQAGRLQQHVRLPPGISRIQRVCTDILVEDGKGLQAGGLHLQVRPFLPAAKPSGLWEHFTVSVVTPPFIVVALCLRLGHVTSQER